MKTLKRDTKRFARQQLSWLRSERAVQWAQAGDALNVDALADDVATFVRGDEPQFMWADPSAANL